MSNHPTKNPVTLARMVRHYKARKTRETIIRRKALRRQTNTYLASIYAFNAGINELSEIAQDCPV